jgi:membrane protein
MYGWCRIAPPGATRFQHPDAARRDGGGGWGGYRRRVATGTASSAAGAAETGDRELGRARSAVRRLLVGTVGTCFRYRVTGLAAEAGFFALLSLPPLVLGLVGSIGYLGGVVGEQVVTESRAKIIEAASALLSARSVQEVLVPTLDDVLSGGRFDLISLGFLLSLWSGSRALNVYVDTITIMYGLSGHRGIIRTRALSFSLYIVGLLLGSVTIPLVLAGPTVVGALLPAEVDWLLLLYWPVVVLLSIVFLTTLYHVAVPVRTPWRWDIPGAVLALLIWVGGSFVLRWVISVSVGGTSIYGPLAAPIVVLLWLYVLALAVLIGAALNAAVDDVWPSPTTTRARIEGADGSEDNPLTPLPPEA